MWSASERNTGSELSERVTRTHLAIGDGVLLCVLDPSGEHRNLRAHHDDVYRELPRHQTTLVDEVTKQQGERT